MRLRGVGRAYPGQGGQSARRPGGRADEGKKPQPYVVIVGVSNYADKEILSRPHAEDDAKALFDLFTDKKY